MTSIPFDPRLVLGQIIPKNAIEDLKTIASLQKPQDLAFKKYNDLAQLEYKIKLLSQKLKGLNVSDEKMKKIDKKLVDHHDEMLKASKDYMKAVVKSEKAILKFKAGVQVRDANKGMLTTESPMDYTRSEVTSFPLASDTIEFDVQYFRNEENDQTEGSHSATVSTFVGASVGKADMKMGAQASASVNTTLSYTMKSHTIEGTIVIIATANQKQADIVSPFVMDPEKAVTMWNQQYPRDTINVNNPQQLFITATAPPRKGQRCIDILSGCAKGASFVGLVNILQREYTYSFSTSISVQTEVKLSIQKKMAEASLSGGTSAGISASFLTSRSRLNTICNLVCNGYIPELATNPVATAVQGMSPDSNQSLQSLKAIMNNGAASINGSMEELTGDAARGESMMEIDNQHLQDSVEALNDKYNADTEVIDVNSMMDAFTNFIEKAQEGEGGVPTSFYIKKINKADVAKCYIRRFFPNGATDPEAIRKGVLGQADDE